MSHLLKFSKIALVSLTTLAIACAPEPQAPAEADTAETYEVRAIVRQLPDPERPGSEMHLQHEAIPTFRNVAGEVVGMDSMTMPFPVADATQLEGVEVGDRVEVDLKVDWDGSPPVEILSIEELGDTLLTFETAGDATDPGPVSGDPIDDDVPDDDAAGDAQE